MTEKSVIHPASLFQVMPPLSGDEYRELKQDIQTRGVMVPIEYDETGNILDGHHRVKACQELGIKDWPSVVRLGMDAAAKRTHARKLNMARRHLNQEQRRGLIQAELKDRPQVSDRQIAKSLGVSNKTVSTARNELVENGELCNLHSSIGADGKERPRQVERKPEADRPTMAQAILSALSDEEQEAVEFVRPDGEIVWKEDLEDDEPTVTVKPTSKAAPAQKPNHKVQPKPKSKAASVKAMVAEIRKQERIDHIERQAAAIEESLPGIPVGPFHVISLDPPWPYGTPYDPNGRRAANPYPEMSLEQIKAIELPAADDCVLWLWTTHRFMRHSFELLDTWGFRDVAIMTWVKDRMGLGTWLRSQSEFCIMAVKGKPPIRLTNQTTILHGPLREHSRKPDSFYEMVDGLCVGAKLDYFSREKREGWAQVGNTPELFKEAA